MGWVFPWTRQDAMRIRRTSEPLFAAVALAASGLLLNGCGGSSDAIDDLFRPPGAYLDASGSRDGSFEVSSSANDAGAAEVSAASDVAIVGSDAVPPVDAAQLPDAGPRPDVIGSDTSSAGEVGSPIDASFGERADADGPSDDPAAVLRGLRWEV